MQFHFQEHLLHTSSAYKSGSISKSLPQLTKKEQYLL